MQILIFYHWETGLMLNVKSVDESPGLRKIPCLSVSLRKQTQKWHNLVFDAFKITLQHTVCQKHLTSYASSHANKHMVYHAWEQNFHFPPHCCAVPHQVMYRITETSVCLCGRRLSGFTETGTHMVMFAACSQYAKWQLATYQEPFLVTGRDQCQDIMGALKIIRMVNGTDL